MENPTIHFNSHIQQKLQQNQADQSVASAEILLVVRQALPRLAGCGAVQSAALAQTRTTGGGVRFADLRQRRRVPGGRDPEAQNSAKPALSNPCLAGVAPPHPATRSLGLPRLLGSAPPLQQQGARGNRFYSRPSNQGGHDGSCVLVSSHERL